MALTSSRRDAHRALPTHTDEDRRRITADAYQSLIEEVADGVRDQASVDRWLARHPDFATDYRPGDIVDHPDHRTWGPACTALLVARDVPSATGQVTPGIHDWYVLDCPDEPAVERTIASFPAVTGSRLVRHDPAALLGARATLAQQAAV